jgi:tetratricopeptide (TPR) repeat protein
MAEANFIKAAERDALDSACRLNLAAVWIWRQEYAKAIDICDYISAKNPQDVRALNNKAIALYYQDKQKNRAEAVRLLEKALALQPAHYESLYNMAIIAEESGQGRQAKNLWEKYLHLERIPRDRYYSFVYEKLKGAAFPPPVIKADFPLIPYSINIGDKVSVIREKLDKEAVKIVRAYRAEIGGEALKLTLQVLAGESLRIILLDDRAVVVEQEIGNPGDIGAFLHRSGLPQDVVHHVDGNFYVYFRDGKGFAVKEVAGSVCVYAWF